MSGTVLNLPPGSGDIEVLNLDNYHLGPWNPQGGFTVIHKHSRGRQHNFHMQMIGMVSSKDKAGLTRKNSYMSEVMSEGKTEDSVL